MARLRLSVSVSTLVTVALSVALLSACSEAEPEITVEAQLEEIEGRALSPREVAERLRVADDLCQLDETILVAVWDKLDVEQFDYQDFVFSRQCPDRATFYALETGRVVTDEAAEATRGVILPTSTRPTTTLRPTTSSSIGADSVRSSDRSGSVVTEPDDDQSGTGPSSANNTDETDETDGTNETNGMDSPSTADPSTTTEPGRPDQSTTG